MDHVCNGLGIGSGPRATAVYPVVNVGEFVRDTICLMIGSAIQLLSLFNSTYNVAASGRPTIGSNDDASIELNSHDRSLDNIVLSSDESGELKSRYSHRD